jgi:hypothetical protein
VSEALHGPRAASAYDPPAGGAAAVSGGDAPAPSPEGRAPLAPAAVDPLSVPRDTTPTWEVELLVSGAVLFGLLQLPSALHDLAERWRPHVGVPGLFAITSIDLLLVGAVYALVGCFVLHLALRGYWVALVGVHSVFPGGPRWDRMREYGPVQTQLSRERVRPLPDHIARTDNVASLVFATGFLLAAGTLSSVLYMAVLALPAWLAASIWGPVGVLWTLGILALPLAGVMVTAQTLDYRLRGADLADGDRRARFIRMVLRPLYRATPGGMRSLGAVLTTNMPKRVAVGVLAVGTFAALAVAAANAGTGGELPGAGNYPYFAGVGPSAVVAGRYGSLRGDAPASDRVPSLDSDVVTGPYARLFIPYRALAHGDALTRACPGLAPLDSDDASTPAARAAADSVLACAARIHRVSLDGRLLDGVRLRFLADPRTNRRGFVAYVPMHDVPPGEHVITVSPARGWRSRGPDVPYELPFWR